MYYAGVDIGGTKTALALFNENFDCIVERMIPTDCRNGCRALVDQVHRVYCDTLAENGISKALSSSAIFWYSSYSSSVSHRK